MEDISNFSTQNNYTSPERLIGLLYLLKTMSCVVWLRGAVGGRAHLFVLRQVYTAAQCTCSQSPFCALPILVAFLISLPRFPVYVSSCVLCILVSRFRCVSGIKLVT